MTGRATVKRRERRMKRYERWGYEHEGTAATHRRLRLTPRIRIEWHRYVHGVVGQSHLPRRYVNQVTVIRDAR